MALRLALTLAASLLAVASLPSVCADEFKPTKPGRLASANRESLDSNTTQSSGASVRTLDLYSCDEHAFCQSCSEGNEYCAAVAWYYGGVGVPLRISYRTEYNYSHGMIGANAAMHALMLDLDFWCKDATLAVLLAGCLCVGTRLPPFCCRLSL